MAGAKRNIVICDRRTTALFHDGRTDYYEIITNFPAFRAPEESLRESLEILMFPF